VRAWKGDEVTDRKQLTALAKPLPKAYIGKKPGPGGRQLDIVEHYVSTQMLLLYTGPYSFEIVREIYDGEIVSGCLARLTVTIDGKEVTIEEYGGLDRPQQIASNGERGKHAASDALKRCAMRLGLGLHMWAQNHYFLYDQLKKGATPTIIQSNGDAEGEADDSDGVAEAMELQEEEDYEDAESVLDTVRMAELEDLSAQIWGTSDAWVGQSQKMRDLGLSDPANLSPDEADEIIGGLRKVLDRKLDAQLKAGNAPEDTDPNADRPATVPQKKKLLKLLEDFSSAEGDKIDNFERGALDGRSFENEMTRGEAVEWIERIEGAQGTKVRR
jgi:hypothetical protein